ncbi:MAG: mechanosensitive ion channel [Bacteroidetes bacterium]|nr:mechanosensitive ion channel [Bacteroidota bacterium]MDA1119133.1 mechanosensitive ion channel [Bacteroidota bacterium]
METINEYSSLIWELTISYLPKLALALVTLIIGMIVIGSSVKMLRKQLSKRASDVSLVTFLCSLLSVVLKALLLISVASMVGIETTSFIAVLGAAGLAVGLALQGSLANFAGGVLILLFKPYKVGDFIDAQSHTGTVSEIQIFNTVLKTPDNKTIIIPNGSLSNGSVTNFTTEPNRRVDMTFGISYGDDIDKAKNTVMELAKADNRIFADPEPFLAVSELADSSVNLVLRVWCESGNYWPIFFDMQENVKKTFDKKGISIPFPQRDVHMYNNK